MKILYVEDEKTHVKIFTEYCKSLKIEFETADELDDVVSKIANNVYDFIIIDLNLQGFSGMDIIKKYPEIDFIVATANSTYEDICDGVINIKKVYIKPYSTKELLKELLSWT